MYRPNRIVLHCQSTLLCSCGHPTIHAMCPALGASRLLLPPDLFTRSFKRVHMHHPAKDYGIKRPVGLGAFTIASGNRICRQSSLVRVRCVCLLPGHDVCPQDFHFLRLKYTGPGRHAVLAVGHRIHMLESQRGKTNYTSGTDDFRLAGSSRR